MSLVPLPKDVSSLIDEWRRDPNFNENWHTNGKPRSLKYNTGRHPGGYRGGYEGVYSVLDREYGVKINTVLGTFEDTYSEPHGEARKGQVFKLGGYIVSGDTAWYFVKWKKKYGLTK